MKLVDYSFIIVYKRVILKDDGTAWAPSGIGHCLSHHVDNGTGNDGTEDGTTWADVQAIQLLQSMKGLESRRVVL